MTVPARSVSLLLEDLGDRAKTLVERLPGKILYPILKRIGSGQDELRVRPGQRHLRDGELENGAVAGQTVQSWGLNILRAIKADMVGAHCGRWRKSNKAMALTVHDERMPNVWIPA